MSNDLSKEQVIGFIEVDMDISLQTFLQRYAFNDNTDFYTSTIQSRLDRIDKIKKYLEDNLK